MAHLPLVNLGKAEALAKIATLLSVFHGLEPEDIDTLVKEAKKELGIGPEFGGFPGDTCGKCRKRRLDPHGECPDCDSRVRQVMARF